MAAVIHVRLERRQRRQARLNRTTSLQRCFHNSQCRNATQPVQAALLRTRVLELRVGNSSQPPTCKGGQPWPQILFALQTACMTAASQYRSRVPGRAEALQLLAAMPTVMPTGREVWRVQGPSHASTAPSLPNQLSNSVPVPRTASKHHAPGARECGQTA